LFVLHTHIEPDSPFPRSSKSLLFCLHFSRRRRGICGMCRQDESAVETRTAPKRAGRSTICCLTAFSNSGPCRASFDTSLSKLVQFAVGRQEVLPRLLDNACFAALSTGDCIVRSPIVCGGVLPPAVVKLRVAILLAPSRFAATSHHFSSISIPMACLPMRFAATRVVPEPQKGSSITSVGSLHRSTSHRRCVSLRGHG